MSTCGLKKNVDAYDIIISDFVKNRFQNIFNLYEDIATIMVEIYPLWDYEWVGSITVDNHNPFFPPSGEKTVPTTLGAKIEVSYSSYEDCGFCPPSNYILYFDQEEYSLIDCGSPCIVEKGIELFEG